MPRILCAFIFVLGLTCFVISSAQFSPAQARIQKPSFITIATTTSTVDSGILAMLLPKFTEKTNIEVRVIALSLSQTLRIARKGDVDLLFINDRAAEDTFISDGYGEKRKDIMYGEFIIAGPARDPANIQNCKNPLDAFKKIYEGGHAFISRTTPGNPNTRESNIWRTLDISQRDLNNTWYHVVIGDERIAIDTAISRAAYILTNKANWAQHPDRTKLVSLCQNFPSLFRPYGLVTMNSRIFPHIKKHEAQQFVNWISSAPVQTLIGGYRINGTPIFTPNAH